MNIYSSPLGGDFGWVHLSVSLMLIFIVCSFISVPALFSFVLELMPAASSFECK